MFLKDVSNFNVNSAKILTIARAINGTNFDGTGNITTANWGTARSLNGVSVNGSTNYTIPVENYCCNVNDNNTNLYHRILTTDIANAKYVDKSIIIVMHSGYHGGGFGIAKIAFRTNEIANANSSDAEIKWLVRHGFAADALVFNLMSQPRSACMDVFYKSPGAYAGMTWYVLSENGRSQAHSGIWTKYNTNASGTNAYTEANMRNLRTYASTLVRATDAGHVSTANSANTLTTARTINGTSFNGSANITTAKWGTARSITIGNTTKTVDGSGNVTWTLAEIGVTGGVSGNYLPLTGGTLTGDLTIKKSDGAVSKINVHRTLSSKDMRGSMDVYSYGGGAVSLSTYNMTDNKQTSSYVFGGEAFWSPRNADGTVPDIGTQSNPFNKGWFNRMQVNTAFYTEGTTTLRGTIHLFNPIMYNASSLKAHNTAGSELHICGVDANNNIFLGLNNQTYINVNNTMRAYKDIHVLNGAAMRITGQLNVARTTTYPQMAIFQTGGDGNGSGDGHTHIGFFQESLGGYTHYFRGGGPVIVDNGGSLQVSRPWIKIGGKSLTISNTAPSAAVGDVWIQA